MDLTPGRRGTLRPPTGDATFAEKMEYYRAQHTTTGVRATHLVGVPAMAAALPITLVKPRLGLGLLAAAATAQIAGHVLFERNSPALDSGLTPYAFCGLAFWCEEVVDLLAGRGLGGSDRPVVTLPESTTTGS